MATYNTQELRDATGKLIGARITTVDALGRQVYTDVPLTQNETAVPPPTDPVIAQAVTELVSAAQSGNAPPGAYPISPSVAVIEATDGETL